MIPFKNSRIKIGNFILNSRTKKRMREIKAVNLKDISSALITYSVKCKESEDIIKELKNELVESGIKTKIVGFIPDKNKEDLYITDKNHIYFSIKDCSFFLYPKQEDIKSIIDTQFNLLINLSFEYHFPLHWIIKMSKAKFKSGPAGEYKDDTDFMIELNSKSEKELKNELLRYLKSIN
ncbi:hypothetical protein QA597_06455 [Marinilabiliaceae bacterium ANBcel2]|nr:hypothetical protein [Marinilabiliaceae bacterium ANBcel2]